MFHFMGLKPERDDIRKIRNTEPRVLVTHSNIIGVPMTIYSRVNTNVVVY